MHRNNRGAKASRSTLPVAGEDGTLEDRLKGTPAASHLQAKTGSLEHVRGISGYATTLHGENLVFSMFTNNNAAPAQQRNPRYSTPFHTAMVERVDSLPRETQVSKRPPPRVITVFGSSRPREQIPVTRKPALWAKRLRPEDSSSAPAAMAA